MDWIKVISEIKQATDLKSVELAKILKVRQPYISELEHGKSKNPKTEFIQALIIDLHVNPNWLFKGVGDVIEVEGSSMVTYNDLLLLKSVSAYDLIILAKEAALLKSAPPGIQKNPDQHGSTDQGGSGRL